jgi:hypothetical protein
MLMNMNFEEFLVFITLKKLLARERERERERGVKLWLGSEDANDSLYKI